MTKVNYDAPNEFYAKVAWNSENGNHEVDTPHYYAAATIAVQISKIAEVRLFLYVTNSTGDNQCVGEKLVSLETGCPDSQIEELYSFLDDLSSEVYKEEEEPLCYSLIERFQYLCGSLENPW